MNTIDLYYNFSEAAYLFFFILIFLILFWQLYQHRLSVLSHFAAPEKLPELLIPQSRTNYWSKVACLCLAWICLCLALMQPKGNARYPQSPQAKEQSFNTLRMQPHEVIFLLDTSASMTVPDGRLDQSRLENAKEIADQVISRLQGQSGSLYAFTSAVSKLSPPSMDYLYMRLMLRNMVINEGGANGTDIKAALQYIHDNYLKVSTPLIKTLILISDGEDNRLEELKGDDRTKYISEAADLLGDPAKEKLHVYTIGVGTKKGGDIPTLTYEGKNVISHLNEDLLKALSAKGEGRYYSGKDYAAVDIAANLSSQIAEADVFAPANFMAGINPSENLIYDLYYQFPLGLAIILLSFYVFWPETYILKQHIFARRVYPAFIFLVLFLPGFLGAAENYAGSCA